MTLHALLQRRFPPPEWIMAFEVRNSSGFHSNRSADAIAMATWHSRGNEIVGFEIKEARSDWLREKKDPLKAEQGLAHCDRIYIVAGDSTIVREGELPLAWGLLVRQGDRLVEKVKSVRLEPKPITRALMANMLRRVTTGTIREADITDRLAAEYERGKKDGHDDRTWAAKAEQKRLQDKAAAFDTIAAACGDSIQYEFSRTEFVKQYQRFKSIDGAGLIDFIADAARLARSMRKRADAIEAAIADQQPEEVRP